MCFAELGREGKSAEKRKLSKAGRVLNARLAGKEGKMDGRRGKRNQEVDARSTRAKERVLELEPGGQCDCGHSESESWKIRHSVNSQTEQML